MADRRRDSVARRTGFSPTPQGLFVPKNDSITAAAQVVSDVQRYQPLYYESWQDEAWDFYGALGEFNYAVEWFGEALSRVRLAAARVLPGGDEPEILTEGAASDLAARFMGGTDGQAQLLRSLAIQLSVVGDSYFVGRDVTQEEINYGLLMDAEPDENGQVWTVQPAKTIRKYKGSLSTYFRRSGQQRPKWEIQLDDTVWVPLPYESLVVRIWDRNERFPWRAASPARSALSIMREIDMYNRHILASLVSRVAMNGMLFIPNEVILPSSPQFENAVDPFIAEMLDVMMSAIKNPGSPASAAPMPVRIPAEFIDKFKHFTFASALDGKVFEARAEALRRLANALNLPSEIITGLGETNHWTGWQLTEEAIKIHIAPKVEVITRGLTLGWLHPMLKAMGEPVREEDGSRIIMWYDTSELTQRPDRSTSAIQLRDMMVINDEATRRETGFSEADAPTPAELSKMILMKLAVNPQTAVPAIKELTGLELGATEVSAETVTSEPSPVVPETPVNSIPDTIDVIPPEPSVTASLLNGNSYVRITRTK